MQEFDPGPTGPVIFKASAKSQLASSRRWLWVFFPFCVAVPAWASGGSLRTVALSAAIIAVVYAGIDWLLRRQLRPGRALVTLYEDGIEAVGFPGKVLWQNVAAVSVDAANNAQVLRLELAAKAGEPDRRSFWTGRNAARPAILLTPFSQVDQDALFEAVQRHWQKEKPQARIHNPMAAERDFREGLKALAPRTWVTYALVAVNAGIWAVMVASGADVLKPPADLMLRWGGNAAFNVQHGEAWRLLTAIFLHGGAMHLVMNMLGLWAIGQTVERIYGHRVFLLIYLGSGLLGSAFSLHFSAQRHVSVGASGAVFGIAGALLIAVLQHRKTLPRLFGKQTLSGMGFFVFYSLAQGFAHAGIDNAAHVGGLLAGALMAWILPERFDMTVFVAKIRSRAVIAALGAAALTGGAVALAPAATVDLERAYAGDLAFQKAAGSLDAAMKALGKDAQRKERGEISALQLDDLGRSMHAVAFAKLNAEFTRIWLPPEDPRSATLAELRTFTALLAESLGMASVVPRPGAEPVAADPVRMQELEEQMKQSSARMTAMAAQVAQQRKASKNQDGR